MKKSDDPELKSVKSLSELMSFQKGRDWWKANGFPFNGIFDLADGSKSMLTLEQYNKDKKEGKK